MIEVVGCADGARVEWARVRKDGVADVMTALFI